MRKIGRSSQGRFRVSRILWIGVGFLTLGTGPLLAVIGIAKMGIGDPNPNPLGFGILAFLTFWPSILLIVVGLIVSIVNWWKEPVNSPAESAS